MSKKDMLLTLIKEAVDKCYAHDFTLIERSMEQASVARIYYYMQKSIECDNRFCELREYNLDSEYNKNGEHIKKTERCRNGTRPDIVLHRRGSNANNLLVAEFKPRRSTVRKYPNTMKSMDFIKLEDFTSGEVYNYFLGVYIKLAKRGPKYTFFQNGREKPEAGLRNAELDCHSPLNFPQNRPSNIPPADTPLRGRK